MNLNGPRPKRTMPGREEPKLMRTPTPVKIRVVKYYGRFHLIGVSKPHLTRTNRQAKSLILPHIALSKFHQQCLLAWKLCYVHSFSPHRTCLWNNRNITIRNKSLFFPRWFQNNINCILCLFDDSGNILSYEQFMSYHSFPTPPKEFNKVIKAISPGLIHLVKCHSLFNPRSSVVTRILCFWKVLIC